MNASVRRQFIPCEIHYGAVRLMGSAPALHSCQICAINTILVLVPLFQIYVTSTSPSALSQMHRLNVIPEPLYQINGDQHQPSVRCLGATLSLDPSVRPMGINTCPSPLCQICRINTFRRPMRDILV